MNSPAMKQLRTFWTGPIAYGLACLGLLLISTYAFPRHTKQVVIGLVALGAVRFGIYKQPPKS
jgi:hypothetical protein